jgi:formimidoylglutamase
MSGTGSSAGPGGARNVRAALPLVAPGVVINAMTGDPEEHRAHGWLQRAGKEPLDCAVFGVPYDGASVVRSGSRHGPDAVRQAMSLHTTFVTSTRTLASSIRVADVGDVDVVLTDMDTTFGRIRQTSRAFVEAGAAVVALGGDHSIAQPLIEGVMLAAPHRRLGVIHFDQHHDLRQSHFGAESSGVPFRKLLELPDGRLDGRNLVQIGIADFANSPAHLDYAEQHGVTVITNTEVREAGLEACTRRALEIAGDGVDGLYVSCDIDCIDQSQAPGTAAPNASGLDARELYASVHRIAADKRTVGMDLVEIAPLLEPGGLTANVGAVIVLSFLAGLAGRGV